MLLIIVTFPTVTNNFDFDNVRWWDGTEQSYTALLPNYWNQLYPILYYYIGVVLRDFDNVVMSIKRKCTVMTLVIALAFFGSINFIKNLGTDFSWDWGTSYGGYQCLTISVIIFVLLLGVDVKKGLAVRTIHLVAEYSFGMYLISWPIDIVWERLMNCYITETYIKMCLLPLSIMVVFVGSLISSIIVTKIAVRITDFLSEKIIGKTESGKEE